MPKTNAIATERNMPIMTDRAFSVFIRSSKPRPVASDAIFISATANVAPSSSNTIDTVVDVGIPNVLNTSSRMMSVTITAINMHMRS